jgi:hypothetical protein
MMSGEKGATIISHESNLTKPGHSADSLPEDIATDKPIHAAFPTRTSRMTPDSSPRLTHLRCDWVLVTAVIYGWRAPVELGSDVQQPRIMDLAGGPLTRNSK